MRPKILQPPDISGAALTELKAWLGISRHDEDDLLENLLHASLTICEEKSVMVPLKKTVEEFVQNNTGLYCLALKPVRAIVQIEQVSSDGTRTQLFDQSDNFLVDASGIARLKVQEQSGFETLAVQYSVGFSEDWVSMPPDLKQAVLRLAAFQFRERDRVGAKQSPLPTSVSMLLQPWCEMRLL